MATKKARKPAAHRKPVFNWDVVVPYAHGRSTARMKIVGGWLWRETYVPESGAASVALVFVPESGY